MECKTCNGQGQITEQRFKTVSIFPAEIKVIEEEVGCVDCNGTGYDLPDVSEEKP